MLHSNLCVEVFNIIKPNNNDLPRKPTPIDAIFLVISLEFNGKRFQSGSLYKDENNQENY